MLLAVMADRNETRITELEIKLTHQDRLLEELNQVVIAQAEEIRRLHKRFERLEQTMLQVQVDPADEPPPHY